MTDVAAGLPAQAPGAKGFARRHPLIAFTALAYLGTWLLEAPMVIGQDGLGLLPYTVPFPIYVILFLLSSYAGPTLAAFLVTGALEGREGRGRLLRRYVQWRVGWPWLLLALLGAPAVQLISASAVMGAAPLQAAMAQWPAFFSIYIPATLIFPAIITWGEEPGWRGFALTRMQARYGPVAASLAVGVLHGLWHLPIFLLVQGPPALGPFDLGEFLFNTAIITAFTFVWTWVFNKAGQSVLIAVLVHATNNAAQGWLGTILPDQPEAAGYAIVATYAVLAVLIAVFTRGRFGYRPAQGTDMEGGTAPGTAGR